jgi:hypothetical protein|tara:strand:- start:2360 stop:2920 length:561 start_codon:yes stop_codon:yes gene_type:complete
MKKLIFIFSFFILLTSKGYGQFWPFTPMVRYGNVVYYELEHQKTINLTKPNTFFDKDIEERFFDILTDKDSIGLKINNEVVYFKQKNRKEPRDQKMIPFFYTRRFLRNEEAKIKYLEIKEVRDNVILAEATIKYKSKNLGRQKQLVEINIEDIEGVFIGPGENQRTAAYILSWAGGLGAGIYSFSR